MSFLDAARGTTSNVTLTMNENCTRCQGKRADPIPQSVQQCTVCKGTGYVCVTDDSTAFFIFQSLIEYPKTRKSHRENAV